MRPLFRRLPVIVAVSLVCSLGCVAQTFEVGPADAPAPKQKQKQKQKKDSKSTEQTNAEEPSSIGWGASLEVAREARAAQEALRGGHYAESAVHAEKAAKAAPQNAELWFLFGYASRLAGHNEASLSAFKHGLDVKPSSVQGLSGLAQTYLKMGQKEQAKEILLQVLAANPSSPNDLQLAGEIFLSSDPQRGLELLSRSDSIAADARTELLMARAYQLLNRPEDARRSLERARNRAPHDSNVLRAVAVFYRESGRYDEAIAAMKEVTAKSAEYWGEFGYTYQLAGKRNEAADAYVRAANEDKSEIGYQLSAALALLNAGKLKDAGTFIDRAGGINPNHYRLHAIRGQLAGVEDRTDDAIREYQAAIASLPAEGVQEGVLYPVELHINLFEEYRNSDNQGAATEQINVAAAQLQKLEVADAGRSEFLRLRAAVESAQENFPAAEKDLREALKFEPSNLNLTLNYGNLLWKLDRRDEAAKLFQQVLKAEPNNRSALTSLGFLAREQNDDKAAQDHFSRLLKFYPNDHVAYLALGDLYTSQNALPKALAQYEKANKLAPKNAIVISRAVNASIESHDLKLAKNWLDRSNETMDLNPQLMRERERYLTLTGSYAESAALGYQVLEKLPKDPEAPVYLGYDLIFLGKHKEGLAIAEKYKPILPKDKDLRLIAGHAHRELGFLDDAVQDFTEALDRDPTMATGYMDRGYVLNDLRRAKEATKDFETAIKLKPNYAEAHLGLAMAYLQMHRGTSALKEVNIAEAALGESRTTHMTRGEAYRQRVLFPEAEKEYRAALRFAPNDVDIDLALADVIFRQRRYEESAQILRQASAARPDDPLIYARLAATYAKLGRHQETIEFAQKAEAVANGRSAVEMAIGEAFLTLGERDAAMQRFARALDDENGDSVAIRLAIARLFVKEGKAEDAREQIGLAFAEARVDERKSITAEDLVEAGDVLLSLHDYELARKYLQRARSAGADSGLVSIAMANAYLAQGETNSAQSELALVSQDEGYEQNYEYLMARANIFRQRQETVQALAAFARADAVSGDDRSAEQAQYELAAAEGRQLTPDVSIGSDASFTPIFEDINIYQMDSRLLGASGANLPPPRASYESLAREGYHLRMKGWPALTGFFEERNARGRLSFPSEALIQERNTYDTSFNTGISPILRLGTASFLFNTGVEFTLRRDSLAPTDLNQNLFRQFLYMSSSSLFNWLSISGSAIHETGPFTEKDLHSRDVSANLNFRIGRPWGNTALITGYSIRDILFRPLIREYFTTDVYGGIQRKFGKNLQLTVLADYLRSWRVEDTNFAIAQSIRPVAQVEYRVNPQWSIQGSFALSRGQGFHDYDNLQSGFLISYLKPLRRTLHDENEQVTVAYPLRFAFGIQQQQFYNFSGPDRSKFLPVIRLSFF
jgi:tetratricopeptide (TPR) repeat protein